MISKKGISLIALSFLVIAIALGGFVWYQQNILSGSGISQESLKNFKLDKTDSEFQNSASFLEQSLLDSAANATQTIGHTAGRNSTIIVKNETTGKESEGINETLLYWRCDLDEVHNSKREVFYQIPSIERVQLSLENKTIEYVEDRLNSLHGIRDNVIYEVGKNVCSEVGYYTPRDVPTNDKFKAASLLDKLSVVFDEFKREKDNMTFVTEVRYNRFWYIFEIMKKWTNDQDMEGNVEAEIAKIPDYVNDVVCGYCPCPYQPGCTKIPAEWAVNISTATDKGVKKTVDELMEERYFDGNEVSCGYTITDHYYDNRPVIMNTPIGTCGGGVILWLCQLGYVYRAEVDVDITCTDQRFKSIPREDLERLNFRIRFNVEGDDDNIHKEFPPPCNSLFTNSCQKMDSPSGFGRDEFIECKIPDEKVNLCDTGIETVGNLSEGDIKEKL